MISFSRADNNILSQWWWTVDRVLLISFALMIAVGFLSAASATPMVANRIGVEKFYFLKKYLIYFMPSLLIIFFVSTLKIEQIFKLSLIIFAVSILLSILTLFLGAEIKGARRWISIFGFSIQPSEFAKPALSIIIARILTEQQNDPTFKGKTVAFCLVAFFAAILVLQPDIGMLVIVLSVFIGQLFLNGLPLIFIPLCTCLGIAGLSLAYSFLPHFTARIDKFLDQNAGDHYQINTSLDAFANGGMFGVGPGEGIIKKNIPDAHADFVFSVIGEEFGFILCALVIILIAFIVVYGLVKTIKESELFPILASFGLLAQFGAQSFINIASSLHLIPTKGMTLPFVSYGGSSMFAVSILTGMILAISKRKSMY